MQLYARLAARAVVARCLALDARSLIGCFAHMSLGGHFWTIVPSQTHRVRPRAAPPSTPWSTTLQDPAVGSVTLRGSLRDDPDAKACLVVVHGLGGSPDAHYCIDAARAAERRGLACLRLSLRGADRSGEDFYHAGLAADLEAAAASAALQRFERLYVMGFSLGGHVTLRYALQPSDARVRSVAAVCAPIDLELSAQAIDRARATIYRQHVLSGLKEIYAAVARRRSVPTPIARVLRIRMLREWDNLTVVPRYGFGSAEHYYEQMSVGPRLSSLHVPALLLQSTPDPMVPPWTYEPHLVQAAPRLTVERVTAGGHVGFPRHVKTSLGAEPGKLEDQVVGWLLQH